MILHQAGIIPDQEFAIGLDLKQNHTFMDVQGRSKEGSCVLGFYLHSLTGPDSIDILHSIYVLVWGKPFAAVDEFWETV